MEKRTDMRAEALDTLIDIERNKKLSHIAIGETLMRNQFEKKADRAFYTRLCEGVTERKRCGSLFGGGISCKEKRIWQTERLCKWSAPHSCKRKGKPSGSR